MSLPPGTPPTSGSSTAPQNALRVAIIGVHGVGSPPRDSTARGIAQLLMRCSPPGVQYDWLEEKRIAIPTSKVDVGEIENVGYRTRLRHAFTAQALDRTNMNVTSKPATDSDLKANEEVANRPDVAFMRKLLRGYRSKHAPYSSLEIVGERLDHNVAAPPMAVHVFEMHWADLSTVGKGLLRIIGAVYQLVQHVSHIGRKTVDIAMQVAKARAQLRKLANPEIPVTPDGPDAGPYKDWARYSWMHSWVIRIFTVLLPIAVLLMLAFVPLFAPAAITPRLHLTIGVVIAAVALTVVGALVIYFGTSARRSANWFVLYMVGIVGAAIMLAARDRDDALGTVLLSLDVVVLTGLAYLWAIDAYETSRSGARTFGLAALMFVIMSTFGSSRLILGSVSLADAESLRAFAFVGFQWSYVLLMVTWGLLWLAVLLAVALRFVLWLRTPREGGERDRMGRVGWTARVTLATAVFSSIMALLVFYRSVVFLADKASGRFNVFPTPLASGELPLLDLSGFFPAAFTCAEATGQSCALSFFVKLIGHGGTSGFVIALLGLALVTVLASWFIVLIAVTAVRRPNPYHGDGRRLGLWMTSGFTWMRRAGTLLAWTLLIAILAGVLLDYSPAARAFIIPRVPDWLAQRLTTDWTARVIDAVTLAVLASAATFGAARLRLEALASRSRPALGVVLDVDNYLRESPVDGTPRAQIAERFASLLRFVEERGRFDRIVIVSHSQGTVITADLLRFLNLGVEPTRTDHFLIKPGRFRLLTMGSPLRQLYGANFPHLYAWVTATDPDPTAPRVALSADQVPDIANRAPDPATLRVERWVNVYTSGDYIGRNLWCDDDWEALWDRHMQPVVGGGRRERCLGAGTHTQYWESADVAKELDELIASATIPSFGSGSAVPSGRKGT